MAHLPFFDDNMGAFISERLKPAIEDLFPGETDTPPADVLEATGKGLRAYMFAETHKNDLAVMLRCCREELNNLMAVGRVPSSFYFERAAILAGKEGNFGLEVKICEALIRAYEAYEAAYKNQGKSTPANTTYPSGEMYKRLTAARKRLERRVRGA